MTCDMWYSKTSGVKKERELLPCLPPQWVRNSACRVWLSLYGVTFLLMLSAKDTLLASIRENSGCSQEADGGNGMLSSTLLSLSLLRIFLLHQEIAISSVR